MKFILEILKFVLECMLDSFSIGDVILYFFGLLFDILPLSPIQGLIDLIALEDLQYFDNMMNFMNFFVPFDIICSILAVWIPFVAVLFSFRVSWKFIFNKIKAFAMFLK